jgi:hypothetical protein
MVLRSRLGHEDRQASRLGARRVAVARKLAVILRRMWADGAEFRFGKETAALAVVIAA